MWWKVSTFADITQKKNGVIRFLGNYEAKIDTKGRAFLPVAFRKSLATTGDKGIVLRKDVFQDCLVLYPEGVWNEQMDTMRRRLSRWDKRQQAVYRQFVSQVEQLTLDGNGRLLVPKRYLAMAGIDRDVRFIGMGDTIELWPSAKAEEPFIDAETFGAALEELMDGKAVATSEKRQEEEA